MHKYYQFWAGGLFCTIVLLFSFGSLKAQCGNQLLLDTWSKRGPSGNGNWVVSADKKSVLQTVNGSPTFFVSPDSLINTTVRGSFSVNTTGDDDYIGFVFGFKGPVSTGTDYDFYLFDWKQNNQNSGGFGYEGFTLARVRGSSTNFWTHVGADITVLDTKYSTTLGWADNTTYGFELTFTDTTITILIDSDTVFNVKNDTATFQNGLFGFYNYSQAQVQYNNFTDNACPVAVNDTAQVIENGAVTINVLTNDTDADVANVLRVSSIETPASNGVVNFSAGGANVVYIPNIGFSGSDSFEYIVSDGVGGQDTAMVYITVIDLVGPHALDFRGNSMTASIPHPSDGSFDFPASQDFSVEMWLKTDGPMTGFQSLIKKGNSTGASIGMSDGKITATFADNSNSDSAFSASRYDDGEWHHIAIVCDRSVSLKIYVDGAADGVDNSVSVGNLTSTDDLEIGGMGATHFEGLIDEVRIWRQAISLGNVQGLMHYRITSAIPAWADLAAYYQMDLGSGNVIYDYSANNNEGTLASPAWKSLSPVGLTLSGDTFVTEGFRYPYEASKADSCSRLYKFIWGTTNGMVTGFELDSLQAEIQWSSGFTSGQVDLSVMHSNWGSTESAASLPVTINPPLLYEDSLTICDGDSAFIDGDWQFASALFQDTVQLPNGLDSIYDVELVVLPVSLVSINVAICQGDSVLAGGSWQTMTGIFEDTLTSQLGCDSIVTTNLTVNPVYATNSTIGINSGDSIFLAGAFQTMAGTYYDSLVSVAGCDSIHATTVSILGLDRYFDYSGAPNFTTTVIDPLVGDPYTTFDFEVTYYDTNGVLPPFGYPRVILDFEGNGNYNNGKDRTIVMTEADANDTDPTDGKVYIASVNALSLGSNYQTLVQIEDGPLTTLFGPFDYPDVLAQPDLEIFANNITFSQPNPPVNSPLTVSATITNTSDYDANNFVVHLVNQYDTTISYPDTVIASLAARSSTTVSWQITTPPDDAWCPMEVTVDYTNVINEVNELDNSAIRPFINGDYNLPGTIVVFPNVNPKSRCSSPNAYVGVSGYAYYTGTAVPLKDSSVAGAEVTIMRAGATYKGLTNSRGYFSISIPAPVTPGDYDFDIEVTDFTLTGSNRDTFEVKSCPCTLPDLAASILLSDHTISVGGSVSGELRVTNYGCDTTVPSNLRVTQTGGAPILSDLSLPALAPGQRFTHTFSGITFNSVGNYNICIKADSSNTVAELREDNNSACAGINVITPIPDLQPYSGPSGVHYVCANPVTPSFSVRNTGTAPAGPFVASVITKLNGTPIDTNYHSFSGLGAGAITSWSIPPVVNGLANTYSFSVEYDTANAVIESNELNNTAGYSISFRACKPDLTIVNCRNLKVKPVDPTVPGAVTFEATVRNSGNDTAYGPIDVRFAVAGGGVVNTQITQDLVPGQSILVQVNGNSIGSGSILLTATVDPNLLIDEFSKSNNSQSDNMCWEFMPVRRCGTYGVNFWEKSYSVHQTAYLSVGVDVDHLYEASSVDVQFEVSGPGISGTQNLGLATVNNLAKTCGCPYSAVLPTNFVFNQAGTYTFTMTVDPSNNYSECDEGNNVKVVTVTVYDNIPDMRILSQYIQPDKLNPEVGENVNLNITYENIGATNIGQQMELKLLVNEMPFDSIKPVFGLVKNDNTTYAIPSSWSTNLPGIHILRAIIDSDNEIVETDELNNEATRAIVVGEASNLFFSDFSVSNTSPGNGDMIMINAKVANNGDVDNDADVEFSYVNDQMDTILIGTMPVVVPYGDTVMTSVNWTVLDSSTTIIAEIINATEIEFTYNDNLASTQIGAFSVNITSIAGCAGGTNGSLTAVVNGGTAPYSYSWSNGAGTTSINDVPGVYTVQVSDGTGFTVTATDTINTIPGSLTVLSQLNICEGDSALIFGAYQKLSNIYYDTVMAASGCDSIIQQTLWVYPNQMVVLPSVTICDNDSIMLFGKYQKVAGLYYDTLQNQYGCDSLVSVELMVLPTYMTTENATICEGDNIWLAGSYQTMFGLYYDTLSATNGCDSIIATALTVNPVDTAYVLDSICPGDGVVLGGAYQTTAGVYYDTLTAISGCDSMVVTNLSIRTDAGCGGPQPTDSIVIVSDSGWSKSTVITSHNSGGYPWNGVMGQLPADATFTLVAEEGQPYPWFSIDSVEGAKVIKTESYVTYFRKDFNLNVDTNVRTRFRMTVDDDMEIYINGNLVASENDVMTQNFQNAPHDIVFNVNGTVDNGNAGGDMFDYHVGSKIENYLQVGINTIVLAIRNRNPNDLGGFSFRMDMETGLPTTVVQTDSVVSDNTWMESTVVTTAGSNQFPWMGVSSLPADGTFTIPATVGQPYSWNSIDEVPGSSVLKAGSNIMYFRTWFELSDHIDLNTRIRTHFDDNIEVYINGKLIAREQDMNGWDNFTGVPFDVMLQSDGTVVNPNAGGDPYDYVNAGDMDTVFNTGMNHVTVVLRNRSNDKGGFSFRMDIDKAGSGVVVKKIVEAQKQPEFELYPNPTSGKVYIPILEEGVGQLMLFDVNGKLVYHNPTQKEASVDLSHLPKGVYYIRLIKGLETYTEKLVKQ